MRHATGHLQTRLLCCRKRNPGHRLLSLSPSGHAFCLSRTGLALFYRVPTIPNVHAQGRSRTFLPRHSQRIAHPNGAGSNQMFRPLRETTHSSHYVQAPRASSRSADYCAPRNVRRKRLPLVEAARGYRPSALVPRGWRSWVALQVEEQRLRHP